MFRQATEADRPAVRALWSSVFGDGPTAVSHYLDAFVGAGNVYIALHSGQLAAILSAVPCHIGQAPGFYLFALATRPDLQGHGLMTRLMAYSEGQLKARGGQFCCLIPASAPLYEYYEKRGYAQTAQLREVALPLLPAPRLEPIARQPLSAFAFSALRRKWLPAEQVRFDARRLGVICADLDSTGASLWAGSEGYAVVFHKDALLLAAELGAASEQAAQKMLSHAAGSLGCTRIRATLPQASPLFAAQGTLVPAALLKPLVGKGFAEGFYLRFALDEII